MRSDNEGLLESAEGEIKRMSQFIDKFTLEAENNKKKIIADCEQKIREEKIKSDEIRAKVNEMETVQRRLEREAEQTKQENMALQMAKSEAMQKQIDLFE